MLMLTKLKTFIKKISIEKPSLEKKEICQDKSISSGKFQTIDIPIYNIRWYPNSKSCFKSSNNSGKMQNPPPLMVRKAEWRR